MHKKILKELDSLDRSERKKKSYGHYTVAVFIALVIFFIVLYAGVAIAALDRTLPLLKIEGQNVGFKTETELQKILTKISNEKSTKTMSIEYSGDLRVRPFKELGLTVDNGKTSKNIMMYGKSYEYFPNLSYFKTMYNKKNLEINVKWQDNSEDTISKLYSDKRADPKNPTLSIDGDSVKIESEQDGFKLDTAKIMKEIEKCFITSCKEKIQANQISIRSNITTKDLQSLIPALNDFINTKYTLATEERKVYPKPGNLISFIDVERTALNQRIFFADQPIDEFLESVSPKVNVKGTKRIINAVDNSVISEGKEGVQLDIKKSRENVKKGFESGQKLISLEIETTPIKEETYSPGNNPGKYPGKFIEVNLSEQNMYLFDGSTPQGTFKVSTGKWSMPTPQGEFSINNKDPRAYSQKYELYMPYWMAFIGSEYGIHELPEWPDGKKEGESHLGTPVSHGCIRLGRGAAEQVYNWTEIGTIVFVHK